LSDAFEITLNVYETPVASPVTVKDVSLARGWLAIMHCGLQLTV